MSTISSTTSLTGEFFVDMATQTASEEELSTAKKTNDVALRAMKAKIIVGSWAAGIVVFYALAIRACQKPGEIEAKIVCGLVGLGIIAMIYEELVKMYNNILQETPKKEGG